MDIITEVQNDNNFDRVNGIRDYASKWHISETEEDIHLASRELYETCALVYGATAIRPDYKGIKLNFYL